jgi:asparagine synthase (glutamine-hydrolysing)
MCGITGFIDFSNSTNNNSIIRSMTNSLKHRGPDGSGFWSKKDFGIYFGHRRLSIIDLSENGSQPFQSSSSRFIITFNGEIYNYHKLKKDIDTTLKGSSDTEILVEYIEKFGIYKTLKEAKGMFAFALWDKKEKSLILCRDRMGEKPLYYGLQNNVFMFASELKSLKAHPQFDKTLDKNALSKYFTYGYIPAPMSIYENIYKLPPGHYLKINYDILKNDKSYKFKPIKYWSYATQFNERKNFNLNISENEALDQFDDLLTKAVKEQMISDVPLGAFLSGGIDSSLVSSIMQKISSKPIKTFTIGFENKKFNEAHHAKKVANFLGTDHTELYMSESNALSIIPKIPNIYCEPFADSSQIPTFLVSKLAKNDVSVSLSGDGGDELFFGYSRYYFAIKVWGKIKYLPFEIRKLASSLIAKTNERFLDITLFWLSFIIKEFNRESKSLGRLVKKSRYLLECSSDVQLYKYLISKWTEPNNFVLGNNKIDKSFGEKNYLNSPEESYKSHMMSFDALSYLPDDILVKVDRAAMSNSLETRVPLLDKDVVEFSLSLPELIKCTSVPKSFLKKSLNRYLPNELIERPKMGFGVPISSWISGELKDWCCDLLEPTKLKNQGLIDYLDVEEKLNEHLTEKNDWHAHLWQVIVFQQWLENE